MMEKKDSKMYDLFGREAQIGDVIVSIYTRNTLALCINTIVKFSNTFGKFGMVLDTWDKQKYSSEFLILKRADGAEFFNNGLLMPKGFAIQNHLVDKHFKK